MVRWVFVLLCGLPFACLGQAPRITQVSDGASFYATAVAPGSIASIFGENLAERVQSASSLPLPTELAGARLSVCLNVTDCEDAGLFYASPTQINFLIPPDFGQGLSTTEIPLSVTVTVNGTQDVDSAQGSPRGINFYYIQPEIFELGYDCWFQTAASNPDACKLTWTPQSKNFPLRGAITDQHGHGITSKNPARIGPTYTLWLTGMGVDPIKLSDVSLGISVPAYSLPGEVNIGFGAEFAGPSPQYAGLYQINFKLPPGILGVAGTGPNAYPPLWPCGEYRWDQTIGVYQTHEWEIPNYVTPINIPILIEPDDAPCLKN